MPTRTRITQTVGRVLAGASSFAILLLLWLLWSSSSSLSTKGSSQRNPVTSHADTPIGEGDAFGRERSFRDWLTSGDFPHSTTDPREGDMIFISQNVRGFKASVRDGWLSAWRGEPRSRRPLAWCIQETNVHTEEEAELLRWRWARLWGKHLDPDAPPLSFWSIGSASRAGVAILLTPIVCPRSFSLATGTLVSAGNSNFSGGGSYHECLRAHTAG